MLRGDFVKDDSGAYTVFIEQGSSASKNNGNYCKIYQGVMNKQVVQDLLTFR